MISDEVLDAIAHIEMHRQEMEKEAKGRRTTGQSRGRWVLRRTRRRPVIS